jgi:hypothetical protein
MDKKVIVSSRFSTIEFTWFAPAEKPPTPQGEDPNQTGLLNSESKPNIINSQCNHDLHPSAS